MAGEKHFATIYYINITMYRKFSPEIKDILVEKYCGDHVGICLAQMYPLTCRKLPYLNT